MNTWRLLTGDCLDVLATLEPESVDACVTDPPYGIGFLGREWDTFSPSVVAQNRTHMDTNALTHQNPNMAGRGNWCGGAAVQYDRSADANRRFQAWTHAWASAVLRVLKPGGYLLVCMSPRTAHRVVMGVEDAGFEIRDQLLWLQGKGMAKSMWLDAEKTIGTALKPMYEPILLARAPCQGPATACRAEHGTGGLQIDGCRLDGDGRWPPNVALDEDASALLDTQAGHAVSRFFYCPKTSTAEREAGCDHLPLKTAGELTAGRKAGSAGLNNARAGVGRTSRGRRNHHPTVKPVALMRWLVRLVTPPGGVVLDPFAGSGTTGLACIKEQCRFLGIEREAEYVAIANARLHAEQARYEIGGPLFAETAEPADGSTMATTHQL